MVESFPVYSNEQILSVRPERNQLASDRPYAFLVEQEHSAHGQTVDVATLFLTNAECPFRCLMCDLWKNTLPRSEPPGEIPEQIRFALSQLPPANQIKLYNSGNFFDPKAIAFDHYEKIAALVRDFDTVIVENHPKLCGDSCLEFRDLIHPAQLEVAIGLETCHPELLASLNKGMTLRDYEKAARFLLSEGISLRTFILLKPPFLNEEEGITWALKSMEYAFDLGVNCCSLVPTRRGNGIMEQLHLQGKYSPPLGSSLEFVLELGVSMHRGRVFMDTWDVEKFFHCAHCRQSRIDRLKQMNLQQTVLPAIECEVCRQSPAHSADAS